MNVAPVATSFAAAKVNGAPRRRSSVQLRHDAGARTIPKVDSDAGANLIGRDSELARVAAALAADRPVWVVGEPGIGKTSLVRAAVARSGRRLYEGAGFATLGAVSYHALPRSLAAEVVGDVEHVAREVERAVGPEILFMDDVQWADRESRDVLARLAGRIAIVVASREAPPPTLASRPWQLVELVALDDASAGRIARQTRPGLTAARQARIVARAAGNPLLLEELARDGSESPTMRLAMAARILGLPSDERHLLWLLALAARPIPVARLPAGIDGLAARALVAIRDGEAQVRHAILGEAIVPLVPERERAALRRELAGLMDDPLAVAGMLLDAGALPDAVAVAEPALADAPPARRAALLEICAAGSTGASADGYRLDAARAYRDLGDDAAVVRLFQRPLACDADSAAWRDALLGDALWSMGRPQEAMRVLEHATVPRLPETPGELEVACARARQLANTGHLEQALELLDEVIAGAGSLVTCRLTTVHASATQLAGRSGVVGRLREEWNRARAAGDEAAAGMTAYPLHNGLLLEVGAAEAARFACEEGERQDAAGFHGRAAGLLVEGVQSLTLAGDLAAAIELGDELLERPASAVIRQRAQVYLARALVLAGRFEEASHVRRLVQAPVPNATEEADRLDEAAEAAYWEGRSRRCLELSSTVLAFPRVSQLNVVLPALVRAWAEVESRRQPDPVPPAPAVPCLAGAALEAAGLELLAADPAAASARFQAAATLWEPFMAPREAVCRWAAGEAARRAGHPEAVSLLRGALGRAEAMSFVPLASRIRRSLRLAGEPVGRRRGGRRAAVSLTEREREVLDLVGRGLTNTEIARQMGLGRPTVAQALSRAMARLGVDSRAQALAAAGGGEAPPLIVVDDRFDAEGIIAETRSYLARSGWRVLDAFGGGGDRPVVLAVTVDDDQAAAAALLAALDGHGLLVHATCATDVRHRLLADLGRIGAVTHHVWPVEAATAMAPEALSLLALVARGRSVSEAGRGLGISRRTADRRLADARAAMGVTTTAGAVGEAVRRGWLRTRPGSAT